MPQIKVSIRKGGKVTVTTDGFTGPACKERTAGLEARFGKQQSEELTAEYYQDVQTQTDTVRQ